LKLSKNGIKTLKNGDFPNGNKLLNLYLDDNPIATIEEDAFQYLTELEILVFNRSALGSLDLSLFKGMNNVLVTLDGSNLLTGMTVSDVNKVPKNITISLTDMALTTIDSKIGTLLANPNFKLDISNNNHIDCSQDISWMAVYVLCAPYNLKADNTQCTAASGGASLENYLKQKEPNACKDTPAPTATTTPVSPATTTTSGSSSVMANILAISMIVIFAYGKFIQK